MEILPRVRYIANKHSGTMAAIELTEDPKCFRFYELIDGRSILRCYCNESELQDRLVMWGYQ